MREMDIQDGTLSIDGVNIQDIKLCNLRNNIALVPQEPSLFHRSIRDNISYARPDASFEEVIEAAKKAQAHDFIMKTSNKYGSGYETKVGEKGVKLSGGQRQRVAIARAFLANRSILIFDEATSSLDSISETKIQQAMDELFER
jgi:ATP-binding cassette subfamily B protein